jgi:hypothetical protein
MTKIIAKFFNDLNNSIVKNNINNHKNKLENYELLRKQQIIKTIISETSDKQY